MEIPGQAQWRQNLDPARFLLLGFALLILIGTFLLSLPAASATGERAPVLDALFTATSAVCVTGLAVVPTASYWSPFGQTVILLLIQTGGLGIMTMSTLFALLLGRRISLRERLLIKQALGEVTLAGLVRLTRYILIFTFLVEGVGALLLFLRFLGDYSPWRAFALGVFHSVSAFNNAGFDLFGNSLEGFRADLLVNGTIMALIIAGGLGFVVNAELYSRAAAGKGRGHPSFSLHTKMVLLVTAVFVVGGAALVFAAEYANPATLGGLGLGDKLLASLFHSVSTRTAGFNTVPIGQLRPVTLLLTVVMMFVGGSSGSTAGGIKTTTFGIIGATLLTTVLGKRDVEMFGRRISREVVDRAWALAVIALALIIFATTGLLVTEGAKFLDLIFEATSAFGTVGLTTGITGSLSPAGKLIVVATMYSGRVGPLTLALALARRRQYPLRIRFPEEKVLVG